MTLSEIKRQVNALKRKYAVALAVVRLRRAAREFCDEWEATREEKKPTPTPVETDQWFYIRGFRLKGHHFFMDYINRCKKTKEDPLPFDIVRGLMPWKSCHRIIENLIHRGSPYERRLGHTGPISPRDLEPAFPIIPGTPTTWYPYPHNPVTAQLGIRITRYPPRKIAK